MTNQSKHTGEAPPLIQIILLDYWDHSDHCRSSVESKNQLATFNHQIKVFEGVYIGLQGPTFETKAEYLWLKIIGGDAVGMSTVPEVIVAIHCGMKVFGMSVITDLGIREEMNTITHEEVLEAANAAAPKMAFIFKELLGQL